MADKIKLLLASVIVAVAMVAFYVFSDHSVALRVLGLIVAVIIATLISLRTAVGANAWEFVRGATVEARKVVWPTPKETSQTTAIVILMVLIMGLILWLFDLSLAWVIRFLTGQGG